MTAVAADDALAARLAARLAAFELLEAQVARGLVHLARVVPPAEHAGIVARIAWIRSRLTLRPDELELLRAALIAARPGVFDDP